MVAPKSQQSTARGFDTHSQLFIYKIDICLIFMQRMRALETVSLNKTVGSLFHVLVTDGMRDAT